MTAKSTTANRIQVPSSLRWVPISQMLVRPSAQRKIDPAWVDHIQAYFDPEKIGYPVLNLADGIYWIIDGQHRKEAAERSLGADQQLHCQVFEGLTEEQEAALFLGKNDTKAVPSIAKFNVAVTAGFERECDIDRIVRHHGCAVTHDKIDGGIGAVGTLIRIYDRSGPGILSRTIRVIRDAYGTPGFSAPVLDGMGLLCSRFNVGELEDQLIIAKLARLQGGVNGLLGRAYSARATIKKPLNQCVAAAAVEVINAGRGGKKLPSWFREDAA